MLQNVVDQCAATFLENDEVETGEAMEQLWERKELVKKLDVSVSKSFKRVSLLRDSFMYVVR